MSHQPNRRIARYSTPSDAECIDLLTQNEFDHAGTERACIARGRAKAWELHRQNGPSGRIAALTHGAQPGASILLPEYQSTMQIGPIVALVAKRERAKFRTKLERSLIDGSILGVRVTLVELLPC